MVRLLKKNREGSRGIAIPQILAATAALAVITAGVITVTKSTDQYAKKMQQDIDIEIGTRIINSVLKDPGACGFSMGMGITKAVDGTVSEIKDPSGGFIVLPNREFPLLCNGDPTCAAPAATPFKTGISVASKGDPSTDPAMWTGADTWTEVSVTTGMINTFTELYISWRKEGTSNSYKVTSFPIKINVNGSGFITGCYAGADNWLDILCSAIGGHIDTTTFVGKCINLHIEALTAEYNDALVEPFQPRSTDHIGAHTESSASKEYTHSATLHGNVHVEEYLQVGFRTQPPVPNVGYTAGDVNIEGGLSSEGKAVIGGAVLVGDTLNYGSPGTLTVDDFFQVGPTLPAYTLTTPSDPINFVTDVILTLFFPGTGTLPIAGTPAISVNRDTLVFGKTEVLGSAAFSFKDINSQTTVGLNPGSPSSAYHLELQPGGIIRALGGVTTTAGRATPGQVRSGDILIKNGYSTVTLIADEWYRSLATYNWIDSMIVNGLLEETIANFTSTQRMEIFDSFIHGLNITSSGALAFSQNFWGSLYKGSGGDPATTGTEACAPYFALRGMVYSSGTKQWTHSIADPGNCIQYGVDCSDESNTTDNLGCNKLCGTDIDKNNGGKWHCASSFTNLKPATCQTYTHTVSDGGSSAALIGSPPGDSLGLSSPYPVLMITKNKTRITANSWGWNTLAHSSNTEDRIWAQCAPDEYLDMIQVTGDASNATATIRCCHFRLQGCDQDVDTCP